VDHLGEILIDMLQENPYPFSSKGSLAAAQAPKVRSRWLLPFHIEVVIARCCKFIKTILKTH